MKRAVYIILAVVSTLLLFTSCHSGNSSKPINNTGNSMNPDLKMQVKVYGKGNPLLLLPGGLTGWKSWEPFIENFTKPHHQVISAQLLNVQFGMEKRPLPNDYSVESESEALTNTLDSLQIMQPIDIIGWSYGGLVALEFALDHPHRIGSLTLIEPPAFWVLPLAKLKTPSNQKLINFHSTFEGNISEEMLAEFLVDAGLVPPGQPPHALPQWGQWKLYRQSLRHLPAIYAHRDNLNRLQHLTCPVLFIKGSGSSQNLHEIIDTLASHLPNSQAIEMPAGHAPHIVSKERFLQEWRKFRN